MSDSDSPQKTPIRPKQATSHPPERPDPDVHSTIPRNWRSRRS